MKRFARFLMWLGGWKYVGNIPNVKKAIIATAPHTSIWDFIWGELAFLSKGSKVSVMIKKEFFFFPIGYLLKALGAIPIDRGKKDNRMICRMADEFNKHESMYLCITPEGSRKLRKKWKRGFLAIAKEANVPIYLGWLNYKDKTCSMGEMFTPTGDDDADMQRVMSFYKDKQAKYPKDFWCGD